MILEFKSMPNDNPCSQTYVHTVYVFTPMCVGINKLLLKECILYYGY